MHCCLSQLWKDVLAAWSFQKLIHQELMAAVPVRKAAERESREVRESRGQQVWGCQRQMRCQLPGRHS